MKALYTLTIIFLILFLLSCFQTWRKSREIDGYVGGFGYFPRVLTTEEVIKIYEHGIAPHKPEE